MAQPAVTVKHIMAGGSQRDTVAGYTVPCNETTAPADRLLAQWRATPAAMREEDGGGIERRV